MSGEGGKLRMTAIGIEDIAHAHRDGFVSGILRVDFAEDRFSGGAVYSHVRAPAFVPYDSNATLEQVEAALFQEGRRMLMEALAVTEGKDLGALKELADQKS